MTAALAVLAVLWGGVFAGVDAGQGDWSSVVVDVVVGLVCATAAAVRHNRQAARR